jgi:hypothetical protein
MLVYSEFRKSKFYPFKSAMRISELVLLVLLVLWYFWYSGTSGTSGTLVLLVLLVLWFSEFLVLCETRVSLSGESSH